MFYLNDNLIIDITVMVESTLGYEVASCA